MLEEYDKLMNEKKNGKIFDFNIITYDELKRLWYEEHFCDSSIANLYDVSKYQVTYKRRRMGINQFDCCWEDTIKKVFG